MIKKARRDPAIVPPIEDMDDETFYKHINARHMKEYLAQSPMHYDPNMSRSLMGAQRAFHERLHALAVPFQHNHTHEGVM